jgi:hypothetical protein
MADGLHSVAALLDNPARAADIPDSELAAVLYTVALGLKNLVAVQVELTGRLVGRVLALQSRAAGLDETETPASAIPRASAPRCASTLSCALCGASLAGRRSHARYCSPRCRAAASVARRKGGLA